MGSGGSVTSKSTDSAYFAIETRYSPTNMIVAGSVTGDGGGAIKFDQETAFANSLELDPGADIVGNVLGGPGTDTLVLGGSGTDSFDVSSIGAGAQYQGFEIFEKTGTSHWILTGSNSTISSWSVDGGLLSVNADMGSTAFTVNSGGSLGGSGTVGDVSVMSGGIVAPGNSPGTLHVSDITFNPGSIYQVQVLPSGTHDLIQASGTATLDGGTVQVLAGSGSYKTKTEYTILTASGGVAGRFDSVTSNLVFLTPSLSYDANHVYLLMTRNSTLLGSVAETPGQQAVAGALDHFPTNNDLYLTLLNQSADGARQAFDALSGEAHASFMGELADQSRYLRDAIFDRMLQASYGTGSAFGSEGPQTVRLQPMSLGYGKNDPLPSLARGPVFWTQGFGGWAHYGGNGNAASASRNLGGFVSGVDAALGNGWRAGLATGYSASNLNVASRYSSSQVNSYHLAAYAGGHLGRFALRSGGAWTWNRLDTSRAVFFPGFYQRETAAYDGDTGQLFGEAAYPIVLGARTAIEPFSRWAYVHEDIGGFREHGGGAALQASSQSEDLGYSNLGLRAATTLLVGTARFTPHVAVGWQHAFGAVDPVLSLAFADTGLGFSVAGAPLAENSVLIETGTAVKIDASLSLDLSYTGQLASNAKDQGVEGRLDWTF